MKSEEVFLYFTPALITAVFCRFYQKTHIKFIYLPIFTNFYPLQAIILLTFQ